jgi:hypothetical protein
MVDDLGAMHVRMWSMADGWARRLEGVYVPLGMLRRYDPQHPPIPTINEGRFYLARQGPTGSSHAMS